MANTIIKKFEGIFPMNIYAEYLYKSLHDNNIKNI